MDSLDDADPDAIDFLLELRDLVQQNLVEIKPRRDGADGYRLTPRGRDIREQPGVPVIQVRDR